MKALFSVLTLFALNSLVFCQIQSTVTINTTGNRTRQISVDSKKYAIDNTAATDQQTVVVSDLAAGQHTLELLRTNQNNRSASTKSSFTLRDGYDLTLTVAANGSISSAEKRIERWGNNANAQLSASAYTKLYNQIKAKTSSTARAAALETEFNTSRKKLTSKQASQLIQLVNSESLRLKLAKQSYSKINDRQNFSLVSSLLNSTANKTALNTYIASYSDETTIVSEEIINTNTNTPLTDSKFLEIYKEVIAEPSPTDKTYYLNNFFSRDFNYYTAAQAKKLVELITTEQDRFGIAKIAYRGVTDKENYNSVYPLLTNSSNRMELVSYVNTYDNNNPRAAMSTDNFDKLYQTVYYQNSSTTRYTYINTSFTTSGNYFTVAQAKKLIPLVSDEANRLKLSKTAYKALVDRSNYPQFNDFLSSTTSRNDLTNYVNNYNGLSATNDLSMNETDFNKLYQSVSGSWSSSSKVSLVANAFQPATNFFTVYQVAQLLSLISTENDKLTLAKNAYDNTVDQNNYAQLYDQFQSAGSKNDLAAFVGNVQTGGAATVKIPMTETEFKSIYRSVQFTFGFGSKFSSLTQIFNTETNYFTVAQAKQLILMVSSEANRLELAKSSYNNITDPANFSQLYDIFSSQTTRNDLMAYVESSASNK